MEEQSIVINIKHLEKATMFVNTNNKSVEDAITQDEVIDFISNSWKGEDYKLTILYKGIAIVPEVLRYGEEFSTVAHITVFPEFSSNTEDYMEFKL